MGCSGSHTNEPMLLPKVPLSYPTPCLPLLTWCMLDIAGCHGTAHDLVSACRVSAHDRLGCCRQAEFMELQCNLTAEQRAVYDAAVGLGQGLRQGLSAALVQTNTTSRELWKPFWSAQQRFFKLLCVSLKVTAVPLHLAVVSFAFVQRRCCSMLPGWSLPDYIAQITCLTKQVLCMQQGSSRIKALRCPSKRSPRAALQYTHNSDSGRSCHHSRASCCVSMAVALHVDRIGYTHHGQTKAADAVSAAVAEPALAEGLAVVVKVGSLMLRVGYPVVVGVGRLLGGGMVPGSGQGGAVPRVMSPIAGASGGSRGSGGPCCRAGCCDWAAVHWGGSSRCSAAGARPGVWVCVDHEGAAGPFHHPALPGALRAWAQ